jgi:hypothetical protein
VPRVTDENRSGYLSRNVLQYRLAGFSLWTPTSRLGELFVPPGDGSRQGKAHQVLGCGGRLLGNSRELKETYVKCHRSNLQLPPFVRSTQLLQSDDPTSRRYRYEREQNQIDLHVPHMPHLNILAGDPSNEAGSSFGPLLITQWCHPLVLQVSSTLTVRQRLRWLYLSSDLNSGLDLTGDHRPVSMSRRTNKISSKFLYTSSLNTVLSRLV